MHFLSAIFLITIYLLQSVLTIIALVVLIKGLFVNHESKEHKEFMRQLYQPVPIEPAPVRPPVPVTPRIINEKADEFDEATDDFEEADEYDEVTDDFEEIDEFEEIEEEANNNEEETYYHRKMRERAEAAEKEMMDIIDDMFFFDDFD